MLNQAERPAASDWLMDSQSDAERKPAKQQTDFPNLRNVLTSDEIDALLRPKLPDHLTAPDEPEHITPKPILELTRQDTAPDLMAAGQLATRFSLALAKGAGFKAAMSLQKVEHENALQLSAQFEAVACFGRTERHVEALVCLPAPLADAIIAQACGARVSTGRLGDGWTLSAIDCALLHQLLAELGPAFDPEMQLLAIETDLPYVASLIPQGDIELATYAIESPGLRTEMQIVQPVAPTEEKDTAEALPTVVPVTAVVTARMARLSVPLSRLTSLKAGSTLLLGLPTDQPVELLSGDQHGTVAFEGTLGRKGNQVAVKITKRLPKR